MDNSGNGGFFRPVNWGSHSTSQRAAPKKPSDNEGFTHIFGPKTVVTQVSETGETVVVTSHDIAREERERAYADALEDAANAAKIEADRIVRAGVAESVALREKAREEGLRQGLDEGRARIEETAARLESIIKEVGSHKGKILAASRAEVLSLTLAVVEKILGPVAVREPLAMAHVIEHSLKLLSDRAEVTIRLNPQDMQFVHEIKPQILTGVDGVKNLTLVEDPSVQRGGAILETSSAEIDGRLKNQLDEIVAKIFQTA